MEFDPQALLLIKFICLLTGTAAIAWGLIAKPLNIAKLASIRFSLANICVFIGIILNTLRTESNSYLYWFCADIVILLGFIMLRWGTQYLFRLKHSTKFDLTMLAITAALMLMVPPNVQSQPILAMLS